MYSAGKWEDTLKVYVCWSSETALGTRGRNLLGISGKIRIMVTTNGTQPHLRPVICKMWNESSVVLHYYTAT